MKQTLCLTLASLCWAVFSPQPAGSAPLNPILLWPQGAPDEKGEMVEEKDLTKPSDGLVAGRRVIRLGNVTKPTLTVHPAPPAKANGAAVVVCPGGAYRILAMDLEGTEVCEWLNSIGVTAVLLKYRVPARQDRERYEAPLQDAQRALSLTRHHARDWGIDPKRTGSMGFSAGAHLSAVTSCRSDRRTYAAVDDADQAGCRPDFVMLIYPAYLTVQNEGDRVAPELTVSSNTPPTFLVQTQDDPVRVESSLFYSLALKQAGVPVEVHLYAKGGHGYGLRATQDAVTTWPQRAEQWLRGLGALKSATR